MPCKHGDWYYYSGVIHVHTTESDGTRTLEEVAGIGDDVNLDFILFSDHMTLSNRDNGKEGWYGNTLALVGYEHNDEPDKNHLLIYDSPGMYPTEHTAAEYVEAAARDNAVTIIAHPDEVRNRMAKYPPYEWTDWSVDNVSGIELWNQMSEWMEKLTPLNQLVMAFSPRKSMVGPTSRVLRWWDELNMRRKYVGVTSVDAHSFPVSVGPFTVRIFPYKVHFRTLQTHLVLSEKLSRDLPTARKQIYDALRNCRVFGSNVRWGGIEGFEFSAANDKEKTTIGGTIKQVDGTQLTVVLPKPARIRLIGNGQQLAEVKGDRLDYTVVRPGVYRVEAWKYNRCWLFSNHIRIGV